MTSFTDRFWQSADGLALHYRDYPGLADGADLPPVVCLPGLTRNARDFADLAEWLSSAEGGGWRVLCVELRGRAGSARAPDAATYTPLHYIQDVLKLLEEAGAEGTPIPRFVAIGTSLGGLMTMGIASFAPERIAGALLNDIGPVLEPAGLALIGQYVGLDPVYDDWEEATEAVARGFGPVVPGRDLAGWRVFAGKVMSQHADGAIRYDYDPAIAAPFKSGETVPLPDLWPGFAALAGRPVVLVHGALSTLVSAESFAEMRRRLPEAEAVVVPDVGHAPELDEPGVRPAIARMLDAVRRRATARQPEGAAE